METNVVTAATEESFRSSSSPSSARFDAADADSAERTEVEVMTETTTTTTTTRPQQQPPPSDGQSSENDRQAISVTTSEVTDRSLTEDAAPRATASVGHDSDGDSACAVDKSHTSVTSSKLILSSRQSASALSRDPSPVAVNVTKPAPHSISTTSLVATSLASGPDVGIGASRRLAVSDDNGTASPQQKTQQQSRKRRASGDSHDEISSKSSPAPIALMTSPTGMAAGVETVDDEDLDDDEDDDVKLQSSGFDPDRLKAFNLFVRLFVDENLDRIVPISKQPKDKVLAILEACDRQFPEFHERARKRIRTYLKSCRRMRRCRDANGVDQLRPTPPHLTSAMAETILAQACENESINAKRMRMGLEPLPAFKAAGSYGTRSSSPNGASTTILGAGAAAGSGRIPLSSGSPSYPSVMPHPAGQSSASEPSSRIGSPPSRPPSSSATVNGSAASTRSTACSAGLFPKQERISPAAAAAVAMVTGLAPDDVALALTSTASSLSRQQLQKQGVPSIAGASPLCFDVQALFGVAAAAAAASAPALPVNGSASVGGFVGGLNPVSHHGLSEGNSGRSLMTGPGTSSILYGAPAATTGGSRTVGAAPLSASPFIQNGPTDLSIKKSTSNSSSSTQHQNSSIASSAAGSELLHDVSTGGGSRTTGPRNQLNAAEIATVRQLIAGYRESAAFLYRSADELENLLLQHH